MQNVVKGRSASLKDSVLERKNILHLLRGKRPFKIIPPIVYDELLAPGLMSRERPQVDTRDAGHDDQWTGVN